MKYLPVFIALLVAIVVGVIALRFFNGDTPPPAPNQPPASPAIVETAPTQEVQVANVYVAARDLPIGTPIQASDLDTQPWPEHLLIEGFISSVSEGEKLVGMVTRAEFRAREPLVRTKLANPDDPNFIAGSLPPGYRAFTIATDNVSGVAGFLFPGDRVDILLTRRVYKDGVTTEDILGGGRNLQEDASETLVYNTKVLAINQNSTPPANGILSIPSSVTLEVTPEQVQRIRLGSEVGNLSLALRSIKDRQDGEAISITRESTLSDSTQLAGPVGREIPVTVIRGTESTGGADAAGAPSTAFPAPTGGVAFR